MLKGFAITPPVVGRISIGRVVERNGMRLPEKDDQFTLTSQVQNRDGWLLHPLDEALRQQAGGKLRSLPVRLLFNDPSLNLRADFNLFDRTTGRPLCVGNGETCKRVGQEGIEALPCPAPGGCRFAVGRPAGVADAAGPVHRRLGDESLEVGDPSALFAGGKNVVRVHHGHAGRVIPAILETPQSFEKDRGGRSLSHITDYTTHKFKSLQRPRISAVARVLSRQRGERIHPHGRACRHLWIAQSKAPARQATITSRRLANPFLRRHAP